MKHLVSLGLIGWLLLFSYHCHGQDAESLMREANGFFNQKKYTNALGLYEKVLALEQNNHKAVYRAGICYLEIGQYDNALEYLAIAKQYQDTTFKDFGFWYAKACYYNQQFDTAYQYLKITSLTYGKEAMELRRNLDNAMLLKKDKREYVLQHLGNEINTPYAETGVLLSKDLRKMLFTRHIAPVTTETATPTPPKTEIYTAKLLLNNTWQTPSLVPQTPEQGMGLVWAEDDTKLYLTQQGELQVADVLEEGLANITPLKGYVNLKATQQVACTLFDYGQKMIFASNQNTKNGDYDLFETTLRRDGTWATPTSLAILNSPADEHTPFMANDGKTLYFSSKGHQNIGGYDVFRTTYDEATKTWQKPENMGLPINSVSDDYWFVLYENIGYLTSNRVGGSGKEDLYKVFLFPKIKVSGKVFHRHSKAVVPKAMIRFSDEHQLFEVQTDDTGKYDIALPIDKVWHVKVILDNKALYEEEFQIQMGNKKPMVFNRNFYIDNREDTADMAAAQTVQLTGVVTDAKTQKPLTQPVQLLDENGKVLQTTSSDALGRYTFTIQQPKGKMAVETHKKGYLLLSTTTDWSEVVKQHVVTIHLMLRPIEPNAKIVLQNVYFAKGSATLDKNSYPALNQLVTFLKENPEVKIEVGGHTDNTGTPPENQQLSEERAKTVSLYLQNKGVAAVRLTHKGYGDTQPIASNDDEEDGREINRRIEVKIMK